MFFSIPVRVAFRGEFCPGKLTLGKILPGKNSVPELKNGGKNSVPSGFGKVKKRKNKKFGAKEIFGLYF